VETYGTVDEAVSALGLARALSAHPLVKAILMEVQKELFVVGAELATDVAEYARFDSHFKRLTGEQVDGLESHINSVEAKVDMPPTFIVPGATPASAALDLSRTIVRRAERRAVELHQSDLLENTEILRYLNRLSDLIYTLARYENKDTDPEVLVGRVP
jgi:cob(I)alamin adenosyltransferase